MQQAEDEAQAGTPDWAAIRIAYEARSASAKAISAQHGITAAQLRYRREKEGWVGSHTRIVSHADLIRRMLKVLDKHLRILEKPMTGPVDKDAMLLSTMTKTLEKLTEMGNAARAGQPAQKKDISDLRDKVAKRIEQLKQG
jgi:hypothetical protein